MKKILVVAAHPDDEILGCGGTMAKFAQEGHEVFTLILGEGITSRDDQRNVQSRENELGTLKKQIQEANQILGVKKSFVHDFPDNRFDSVALLDIVKVVEKIKKETDPDIIFTHHEKDLNIDHEVTYRAVLTATRPLKGEKVHEIYAFEVLSSTEWRFPLVFSPSAFFDISQTIDLKVKAMEVYTSELRDFPHPRSADGIRLNAQYWGIRMGLGYVEAFQTVRTFR